MQNTNGKEQEDKYGIGFFKKLVIGMIDRGEIDDKFLPPSLTFYYAFMKGHKAALSHPTTTVLGWVDEVKERIEKIKVWKLAAMKGYVENEGNNEIEFQSAGMNLCYDMEIYFLEKLLKSNSTPTPTNEIEK